ncbi:MAG: zinc dependent phospholipase C family protein, partial [Phycisphaerae bacterium]
MRLTFWTIIVALVCLLGQANEAFAWGPATHMGLAASALEHLLLVPAAVAAVLARHRIAFFYGNIATDIVFAKRLSRVKQFCHHWSTGFRLLDTAEDDRAKAFAYGYLSHLAADTVAHGKYVPRQIVVSQCSVNFGHFYWELR